MTAPDAHAVNKINGSMPTKLVALHVAHARPDGAAVDWQPTCIVRLPFVCQTMQTTNFVSKQLTGYVYKQTQVWVKSKSIQNNFVVRQNKNKQMNKKKVMAQIKFCECIRSHFTKLNWQETSQKFFRNNHWVTLGNTKTITTLASFRWSVFHHGCCIYPGAKQAPGHQQPPCWFHHD